MSQTTLYPAPEFTTDKVTAPDLPPYWLYALFFLSGFPALIYQIAWQRTLFIIYGVNVESVTVVVTAFMLGLGLGSLVGGRVSRSRVPLVLVFAAVELCTAVYGVYSLQLFHKAAQFTAGTSTFLTGVCAFALVVTPTVLMGSTLPILLAYLIKTVPNMGRAAGILYFVNTLGSATACFVAGQFTMRLLGMSGSVRLAAGINAAVGLSALAAWVLIRKRSLPAELNGFDEAKEEDSYVRVLPLSAGIVVAGLSGFIALGFEIVWYRVFSWASATNPKTFAFLLGAYLAGLALGALVVERRCRANGAATSHLRFVGLMLVGGNVMALLVPTVFSDALHLVSWNYAQGIALVWVACSAAMLGTTFPMLCHLTVRPDGSAGEGVSFLYLSNILGSVAGSLVAGYILSEIVSLLVISAGLAAAGILLGIILMRRSTAGNGDSEAAFDASFLSFPAGIALAAFSGFIALGYGMVWFREFTSVRGTTAVMFEFLLGSYLAGLALGAVGTERRCRSIGATRNLLWFTGMLVVAGNILALLVPPVFSVVVRLMPRGFASTIAAVLLASAGALLGTTLPLASRLTERPHGSGRENLSPFYLGNLAGSVAGAFVAGYVLVQLPPPALRELIAAAGFVIGFTVLYRCSGSHNRRHALVNVLAGVSVLFLLAPRPQHTYENLYSSGGEAFARVVENRHGVIAVGSDNRTVIGGGVYDGMFNIDPVSDVNSIKRCYALFGFLSRAPRHVLMIGLSSGSWAQVLVNHPEVESLDIVEINPGYLKLIPDHPEVASILHNPKVNIVIDDGHRWLLRNPDSKFDLIVMNTSISWRANATNLLSREFLELVRRHLEPGGAHFYNTTWSPEALVTAVSVFPYAVRISNFIAVSDNPLRFDADRWKGIMKAYRIDSAPLLDVTRHEDETFLDTVVSDAQLASSSAKPLGMKTPYFDFETSLRSRLAGRTVVTDDNMAVEWRGGNR
jgi:spermidine synthase